MNLPHTRARTASW